VKLDENATHFDKIAAAAHQKFNTLAATVVESMVGRKVMAAIVMTSDQISVDSGCVVSLATGACQSIISHCSVIWCDFIVNSERLLLSYKKL